MDMTPQAWPDWYDGRHINEVLFCQQFLEKYPMKCVRGRLFTVDGLIEDEGQIGNLILEEISGVLTSGLSKVVTNLLASICHHPKRISTDMNEPTSIRKAPSSADRIPLQSVGTARNSLLSGARRGQT